MSHGGVHPKEVLYDRVRDFLFAEAELIDTGRLAEWANLFAADGWYYVPALDAPNPETATPDEIPFIVADNRARLAERIKRMDSASAYPERPRSQTLHTLSNIRVVSAEAGVVRVRAHFLIQLTRHLQVATYFGTSHYTLLDGGDGFLIREKRACLGVDALKPQGSISIIL